jgi:predicted Zn-dependent peptidase
MPNGLTVIVKYEKGSGIAAIEVFIKTGAAEEREYNAGIGNLVARTLLASTRNKRAETVAAVVDEVGGSFQTEWHQDYTEIKAITTTFGFNDAISLLGDILNNANFEQHWVDVVRQEIITEMNTEGDDVFQTTYAETSRKLYRDNPYRRPTRGYIRAIKNLTPADMLKFYQKYYVPNNIVVSIVGDITPEQAIQRLKMAFAGTSAVPLPRQLPIPPEELTEPKCDVIEKPIDTAYFMFGFLAPSVTSPDYPAMRIAASALGSGKGSRMFQNLREKKGLAYELGTIYPLLKNQSHILAYLVTDPYRRISTDYPIKTMLEDVKKAMLDEVTKLQNEPLSDVELERAKQYTIGTYALEHQRLRDRAFHLGWLEAVGLGCEYDSRYPAMLEAVTAADVQRMAKKYLNNYALTIVLPEPKKDEHN